jgi:hypothetical protein
MRSTCMGSIQRRKPGLGQIIQMKRVTGGDEGSSNTFISVDGLFDAASIRSDKDRVFGTAMSLERICSITRQNMKQQDH